MKPARFKYANPASLSDAASLLGDWQDAAKVLAGGQSLMPMMNMRLARPDCLIDLRDVPELRGIREDGDGLLVGAMTHQADLERSEAIARRAPLVSDCVQHIGHPPIRRRGTIGGSVAHADPSAELPAALVTLDATLEIKSTRGGRSIMARDCLVSWFTTTLEPDEILVTIRIPAQPSRSGAAVEEIARRHGDFALAGAMAVLEPDPAGRIASARVTVFGVAEVPVRLTEVESVVVGERNISDELLDEVGERVGRAIEPESDMHASGAFRRHLAKVVTGRALRRAYEATDGQEVV